MKAAGQNRAKKDSRKRERERERERILAVSVRVLSVFTDRSHP